MDITAASISEKLRDGSPSKTTPTEASAAQFAYSQVRETQSEAEAVRAAATAAKLVAPGNQ